ncbi:MAG: metallophosphoesterase, partial [Thermoleophilaceae bacterium]
MNLHSADTVEATPRRVAIVSDVHGNLPAFQAVLDAVRATEAEVIWCLGDLVGYGAQPD